MCPECRYDRPYLAADTPGLARPNYFTSRQAKSSSPEMEPASRPLSFSSSTLSLVAVCAYLRHYLGDLLLAVVWDSPAWIVKRSCSNSKRKAVDFWMAYHLFLEWSEPCFLDMGEEAARSLKLSHRLWIGRSSSHSSNVLTLTSPESLWFCDPSAVAESAMSSGHQS